VFARGRRVYLRPLDKATDLERCTRWTNDPEVTRYLARCLPMTLLAEENWFDKQVGRENDFPLAICTSKGRHIGNIGLHQVDMRLGVGTTGTLIGEKAFWGKGYGSEAKMLMLAFAFRTLSLRKVYSDVIAFNERSLRYSLGMGHKVVGRRRDHWYREGRYWDDILLELFRADWEPLWAEYEATSRWTKVPYEMPVFER